MSQTEQGKTDAPSGRVLILGVAAGIVVLVVAVILLWPGKDPKPERARKRAAAPSEPASLEFAPEVQLVRPSEVGMGVQQEVGPDAGAAPPPVPEAETVDLFSGPAPEIIWRGHDIVDKGGRLHSKRVKQVYEFSKEHPEDARPEMILALDSMNRGWYAFAVGHYRKAIERNPDAAKDPRVMRDFLKMATNKHHAEKAHAAIVDIWGAGALPAVQARLDELTAEGKEREVSHLEELATTLRELEAE